VYQGSEAEGYSFSSAQTASFTGDSSKGATQNSSNGVGDAVAGNCLAKSDSSFGCLGVGVTVGVSGNTHYDGSAAFTYTWYRGGSYSGGSFAFSTLSDSIAIGQGVTVTSSFTSTEAMLFAGKSAGTSAFSMTMGFGGNSNSNQFGSSSSGVMTFSMSNVASGSSTAHAGLISSETRQGTYAGGSYSLSSYALTSSDSQSYSTGS